MKSSFSFATGKVNRFAEILRQILVGMVPAVFLGLLSSSARAGGLYTYTAIGGDISGTWNGNSFTNATWSISMTADPSSATFGDLALANIEHNDNPGSAPDIFTPYVNASNENVFLPIYQIAGYNATLTISGLGSQTYTYKLNAPIYLVLLCLLGPLFKASRRQAIATFPVEEPCFLVALQSTVHIAPHMVRAVTLEQAGQHTSDHDPHLRDRQGGCPDFFPAWSPA